MTTATTPRRRAKPSAAPAGARSVEPLGAVWHYRLNVRRGRYERCLHAILKRTAEGVEIIHACCPWQPSDGIPTHPHAVVVLPLGVLTAEEGATLGEITYHVDHISPALKSWVEAQRTERKKRREAWARDTAESFASAFRGFNVFAELRPHLDALNIGWPVTAEQLKTAYRDAAKKAHPDAGGSNAAFIKVTQAYEVLSKRVQS